MLDMSKDILETVWHHQVDAMFVAKRETNEEIIYTWVRDAITLEKKRTFQEGMP